MIIDSLTNQPMTSPLPLGVTTLQNMSEKVCLSGERFRSPSKCTKHTKWEFCIEDKDDILEDLENKGFTIDYDKDCAQMGTLEVHLVGNLDYFMRYVRY